MTINFLPYVGFRKGAQPHHELLFALCNQAHKMAQVNGKTYFVAGWERFDRTRELRPRIFDSEEAVDARYDISFEIGPEGIKSYTK